MHIMTMIETCVRNFYFFNALVSVLRPRPIDCTKFLHNFFFIGDFDGARGSTAKERDSSSPTLGGIFLPETRKRWSLDWTIRICGDLQSLRRLGKHLGQNPGESHHPLKKKNIRIPQICDFK